MSRTRENHFVTWSDGSITKISREFNSKQELSDYVDTDTYSKDEASEISQALITHQK